MASENKDTKLEYAADPDMPTIAREPLESGNFDKAPLYDNNNPHVVDKAAECHLTRRFDVRLMPVLAIMYLFNALDKGNLGNAETAGLSKDLNFKEGQYNLIVGIFFVPFVVAAPFVAMVGKRYGPALVLPILMMTFGSMTLLTAAANNFGGIFALRWFLGMAESAFFPLVIYYLTTFYRRGELARRLGIFYAASNIANAFSGLLAFGTFQITDTALYPWRWLFIIEGIAECSPLCPFHRHHPLTVPQTLLFAAFALWYLPKSAQEAKFLSEEEKALAFHRIQVDSSSVVGEKLSIRESIKVFKHPATWGFLLIEVCIGVPIQSVGLFMPQIIQRLGFGTIKTNLCTVAPHASGAVTLLILAFLSDWRRLRFPFIALGFVLTLTGFVIYAVLDDVQGRIALAYFATFMMTWGTSAPSVLLVTWYNNNIANENQRVLLTSIGVPLGSLMGLVSSNIFRKRDAPKYEPALITTASFGAVGALLTLCLGLWMMWDNKRRNTSQGKTLTDRDVSTSKLQDGPSNPDFRWFL